MVWGGVWSLQGESPPEGCVAALPTTSPEWPTAVLVLTVSETCAWVSEVKWR